MTGQDEGSICSQKSDAVRNMIKHIGAQFPTLGAQKRGSPLLLQLLGPVLPSWKFLAS